LETLLKDAAGVIFVEPCYCKVCLKSDDLMGSVFSSEIITDSQLVSEWKQALVDASPADWRSAPMVGYFAHLFFLDKEQKPIASVSISNWKCIGGAYPIWHYRNKKNGIIIDWRKNKNKGFCWQSEPFVRSVYNYMELNRADELQKKRDDWSRGSKGRLSLEKLLFEGDDSQ